MDTRNHRLNRNERSVDDDSLDTLLDRIDEAAREKNPVSIGDIVEATGTGSFSPLLLFAVQLMMPRHHVWLPSWLAKPSVLHTKWRKSSPGSDGPLVSPTSGRAAPSVGRA